MVDEDEHKQREQARRYSIILLHDLGHDLGRGTGLMNTGRQGSQMYHKSIHGE